MILSAEKYLELTADLADAILHETRGSGAVIDVLVEHENGDIRYTEEAQDCFNKHLDMVCARLSAHGIYKEGEQ